METEPADAAPRDTFAEGVGLAIVLHVVGLPIVAAILVPFTRPGEVFSDFFETLMMVVLNFGWTQIPYALPVLIFLHVRRRRLTRNGFALIAGLGFLVTSGCWGLVAYGF